MTRFAFKEVKCSECGSFGVEGRPCSSCNDLSGKIYCPVCGEYIYPINHAEVTFGWDDCFIYVHRNTPHDDEDMQALSMGVN